MDIFSNQLYKFNLTSKQIESLIRDYDLVFTFNGRKFKDPEVEHGRFPKMRTAFYELASNTNSIPTQSDFFSYYISSSVGLVSPESENIQNFISKYMGTPLEEDKMFALKSRIYRSYPSFIRELHVYAKLKDINRFDEIIVNCELDLKHDIDVCVCHNSKYYGLVLFVDTSISNSWRTRKVNRHEKLDNVTYIEIPIKIKKRNNCGKFELYPDEIFNDIISKVITDTE